MRAFRILTCIAVILFSNISVNADILEDFRRRASVGLNEFHKDKKRDLENLRRCVNEEIAAFMSQPWTPITITPKLDRPIDPSPDPIYVDMDTVKHKVPQPVVIKEIINIPDPITQPHPIEPIIEIKSKPADNKPEGLVSDTLPVVWENDFDVMLYGTKFTVRHPDLSDYDIKGNSPAGYADAWRSLNNTNTNNLIIDCLSLRENKQLCDWAYLQLVRKISSQLFSDNPTKATLLSGFLLSQCGYRIRFATDSRSRLHLLYSSKGIVYEIPSFNIDGDTYYIATDFDKNDLNYKICNFKCPGEQSLSFEITRAMYLDYEPAQARKINVHNHPEIEVNVIINRNLIDFYNSYPVATVGEDRYTQWAIYANTPVSPELQRDLYPVLKEAVRNKSQKEAANLLIHLVESFPYGYDSQIWGRDRAFFMDESWYYPFSDCEEHAIHFTRLIRDILGLEAVLVCYPEHLASAVAFTDAAIEGDYVVYKGKRFTICDPTIFYADVGTTMTGCDNSNAVLIDLICEPEP